MGEPDSENCIMPKMEVKSGSSQAGTKPLNRG
jgi:hypothetical protein